jgi:hypothetical protein
VVKNLCWRTKTSSFYYAGLHNLYKIMDIEEYLKFYLEMNLVKEIIFDKLQLDALEIISKVDQFIKIFLCEESHDIFKDYIIGQSSSTVFNSIKEISNRKNFIDVKLINIIQSNLEL